MTPIADPSHYFWSRGGLHDAFVTAVMLDLEARTLTLQVDDLDANFVNPPVAPPRPALLCFHQLSQARLAVDLAEGVRIGELSVEGEPGLYSLRIALSLGGIPNVAETWWISALFRSASISETSS